MEIMVERLDPERYFAYRWHPYAIDPGVDYSKEPTTLVEFHLEDVAERTAEEHRAPCLQAQRDRASIRFPINGTWPSAGSRRSSRRERRR